MHLCGERDYARLRPRVEREGYHLNQGPHALYLGGPAEAVLRELGVDYSGAPPAGPYYGLKGDAVELWPVSATTLARSKFIMSMLRMPLMICVCQS